MDFKQFRYFVAVAHELHMGRAANKLRIAQPALSQQIKLLEHSLNTPLFNREKRGISLTDAGREFLIHAREAVEKADAALELGRRAGRGEYGRLRVGYSDTCSFCPTWRKIIGEFRRSQHGVDISLHAGRANALIKHLEQGTVDVVTLRGPLPMMSDGMTTNVISAERIMVALPEGHHLADVAEVAVEDLANEDITCNAPHAGSGFSEHIRSIFRDAGVPVNFSQRSLVLTTAIQLVACGFGLAVLPASFASLHVPGTVYRPLSVDRKALIHLVRRKDEKRPVPLAFINAVQRTIDGTTHQGVTI